MDDAGGGIWYLIFFLFLIIDVVVYGIGTAMHSMHTDESDDETTGNQSGGSEISGKRRERRRQMVRRILKDQSDYVDTVQTVTAFLNLLYGCYLVPRIGRYFLQISGLPADTAARVWSDLLAALLFVIILEVLGVQIPKRLASRNPEKWISRCGWLFYCLMILFLPFTRLISLAAKGLLLLFGVRGSDAATDVTEEEIRSIVNEGHEQGVLQQSEAEMISNIFEFNDKQAHDIMTHRNDIIAIDASWSVNDAIEFMLRQHNSRFPIYEDNIDNIIGITHIRDLMRFRESHPDEADRPVGEVQEVLRSPVYVPETKNIDELFRQMQQQKTQMVIVIDEYGQTSGLIAMEDILEEIVGNIMDEYDVEENHITATANKNEYVVDGRTPLEELEKKFGLHFDHEHYETLNGFLMSCMDRVPRDNERFVTEYEGYRFRVLSAADRQVQRVLVTKI